MYVLRDIYIEGGAFMNEIVQGHKEMQLANWRKGIDNTHSVHALQKKLDDAEKRKEERPFSKFNDIEIIQWFLFRREHLDVKNDKSLRTRKEYQRELSLFIEQLLTFASEIDVDIDSVNEGSLFKSLAPRHIRRYQEWLKDESPHVKEKGPYAAATLARKTTILRNFFLFLYEVKYISEPLHTGLFKATVKSDDRPNRDLGAAEVIQLLDYFRNHQHPIVFSIIHVLTTTGIRNEEFCKLTIKDLAYDSITGGYYLKIHGKGNKKREVPIREKTLNSIRMFRYARGLSVIEESHPDDPLFTTNTGKSYSPSYLSQYLSKEIKKSGLTFLQLRSSPIGPHTFRHAMAIISHQMGSDLLTVSRSLGHEKIETTMVYLEKIFEKEKHAIHKWNSELFGEYV